MRCSLPIRSGQVGDVDSGDDWADPAGAFPQGEDHQGDRAGPEGVPEHGPQGAAVGGDIGRIRKLGSAPADAGPVGGGLDDLLAGNATKPAREQLTLIRIFEELHGRGYEGGYDAVRRYARRWAKERGQSTAAAYVPLSFAPGEAYQFDWSHEVVLLNGVTVMVKAA